MGNKCGRGRAAAGEPAAGRGGGGRVHSSAWAGQLAAGMAGGGWGVGGHANLASDHPDLV